MLDTETITFTNTKLFSTSDLTEIENAKKIHEKINFQKCFPQNFKYLNVCLNVLNMIRNIILLYVNQ